MSRKNGGRRPPSDYSVGYGRPPAANQFKPGQSGNPFGRRPKPKGDEPMEDIVAKPALGNTELDQLINNELNRSVDAQENGKSIKLSVLQGALRSMGLAAMKGRKQAQRSILQLAHAAQENARDRRAYARDLAHNYRRRYPEAVRAFEKQFPGKFCYLAHPDDVFYNEELGNRTRHCISAFGQKLTPAERSNALKAISGPLRPAAVCCRLWELGSKEPLPGHVICNARLAAARIHEGQEVTKVISHFRESLDAG